MQSSLLWHFFFYILKVVSNACPLCGSRLLISYVPPHVDVGVDSWSQHSLYYTDHTCNNKQRFVDLQLQVYAPSA